MMYTDTRVKYLVLQGDPLSHNSKSSFPMLPSSTTMYAPFTPCTDTPTPNGGVCSKISTKALIACLAAVQFSCRYQRLLRDGALTANPEMRKAPIYATRDRGLANRHNRPRSNKVLFACDIVRQGRRCFGNAPCANA